MGRFVVVTPNPAVDVTYTVDRLELGQTVRVRRADRAPGGKGLNVARVLHQLGREVLTVQPLGGDSGRWIAEALEGAGIANETVWIRGMTRTTVAIANGKTHPTLLAEPGPTLDAAEWSRLADVLGGVIRAGDWVVIAGSFPAGATAQRLVGLIGAARSAGARVLVDTSGPFLRAAAREGADIVKANRDEIREATDSPDVAAAIADLTRNGSAVMVSLGAEGARFSATGSDDIVQPAVVGVYGNPTGAGDAATAGLLAALADGHEPSSALFWAAVLGAAAVESPVAGHLDLTSLPLLAARLPQPASRSLRVSVAKPSGDSNVAAHSH